MKRRPPFHAMFVGRIRAAVAAAALGLSALSALSAAAPGDLPLSVAEARPTFELEPGLVLENVAVEPVVKSPSAMAWDEHGRLFVAENPGYPVGPKPGIPPVGALVELIDDDGDGHMERRREFAGGLGFPNGLMPWRGGWLVTDAPDLLWLADTNHDGRADVREVWWTGFATHQTTQLRACYPVLGPDGWIYVARGLVGGVVHSPKWTHLPPVDLAGGDFRFRPDGSAAEAVGGNAQFGQVLDDLGRRFTVSNRNPLMHVVVGPRWWARHPGLPMSDLVQNVSPAGYEARVFPISPDLTTAGFIPDLLAAPHAGTFTAACGIHQYFGEALGPGFSGSWFVCEPAQNLVQRQLAEPDGPTFRSRPVPQGRDFLASRDPWFRPVFAATGPDGALYLVDMYRKIIDHPAYLPEDVRGKLDFDAGKDRGRIWRVRGARPLIRTPLPGSSDPAGWFAMLGATNGWTRETAYRLLVERGPDAILAVALPANPDPNRQPPDPHWSSIRRRAQDAPGQESWQAARRVQLLALALEASPGTGAESRPADVIRRAIRAWFRCTLDESPTVRIAAWRVLQRWIVRPLARNEPRDPLPGVPQDLLFWWAEDPSPAARFEFALVAGEHRDAEVVVPALARVAARDGADRWTRAAVLGGLNGREIPFAEALVSRTEADPAAVEATMVDLGRLVAGLPAGPLTGFLAFATAPTRSAAAWVRPALRGVLVGWRSRGQGGLLALLRHLESTGPLPAALREAWHAAGTQAAREAADPALPPHRRLDAVEFLGELDPATGGPILATLTRDASVPVELAVAAVRAVGRLGLADTARSWLARNTWDAWPTPLRDAALGELSSRAVLAPALLDAVEKGDLPPWSLDAGRRRALLGHSDPALRERARRIWAEAGGADRRQVYEAWKSVTTLAADGPRGRLVFEKACASCHQLDGVGYRVGPDLSGVRNQPAEALLLHIIVPDAELSSGFQATEIETRDGRILTGLVTGESPSGVTLRKAGGEDEVLARAAILTRSLSRMSLMPQELEKTMSRQDMADLLAWLKGAR